MHQLYRLCVLQAHVLFLAYWLHEVLVNHLSDFSPLLAILHEKKVVALSDKDDRRRKLAGGYTGCFSYQVAP